MIPGPIQPRRVSDERSNEGCILCEARDNVWRAAYPYTADGLDGYVEACGPVHAAEQIHDEFESRRGLEDQDKPTA